MFSTAVWVGHPQSRELTGFGGPTAGPIWHSYMSAAQEGQCPEFEVPDSLPELSGLNSEHTSSSGYSSGYEEEETYEGEEEESEPAEKGGEKEAGGGEEGGERSRSGPDAHSHSGPFQRVARRRHQPRLAPRRYSPISSIR